MTMANTIATVFHVVLDTFFTSFSGRPDSIVLTTGVVSGGSTLGLGDRCPSAVDVCVCVFGDTAVVGEDDDGFGDSEDSVVCEEGGDFAESEDTDDGVVDSVAGVAVLKSTPRFKYFVLAVVDKAMIKLTVEVLRHAGPDDSFLSELRTSSASSVAVR